MNEKALGFFKNLAKTAKPETVKLAHNTDYTDLDAKFILKYATKESEILDLGTGTGLIVNKLYPFVGQIVCVESFQEFTQFIVKAENVTIVNQDLFAFEISRKFDLVTAFGVMQYMNEQESIQIYSKYKEFLKPNGKFIIKNQFGIYDTVNVAGYSEEQKQDYYSQYRHIDKEKEILMQLGFDLIEINDIYPKEANRWACGGGATLYLLLCPCRLRWQIIKHIIMQLLLRCRVVYYLLCAMVGEAESVSNGIKDSNVITSEQRERSNQPRQTLRDIKSPRG